MIGVRSAAALSVTEIRLFAREPFAVFFSLAFPLVLLLFVGSIGGVARGVRWLHTMSGIYARLFLDCGLCRA